MSANPNIEGSPQQRMFAEFHDVAMSDEASMTFTTVDPESISTDDPSLIDMHSCTTWFAPLVLPTDDEVRIYSLSAPAPARVHSENIEAWEAKGVPAPVSGAIRADGQVKNDPNCHGVSFKGEAITVRDDSELEAALGVYATYNTFDKENRDKYFNHSTEEIPTHRVFRFKLLRAVVMDGRLGDDNPDRMVRLTWVPDIGWVKDRRDRQPRN